MGIKPLEKGIGIFLNRYVSSQLRPISKIPFFPQFITEINYLCTKENYLGQMDKKKLVFATNNAHKLSEVRAILKSHFEIVSLAELDCYDDIPETANTLDGNALLKALMSDLG